MREHSSLLRTWRAPDDVTDPATEPRPGFYALVMERIEAQRPLSIWNVFFESTFGRRIALASMALALLLGIYLVTSEQSEQPIITAQQPVQQMVAGPIPGEDQPGLVLAPVTTADAAPDDDSVLVNLVTYQDQ